jgi:DNA-binding NtrC family response regulator
MIGMKLLMIDDEEAFVAAMEKRMTHRGIEVAAAHSGLEGLKKLEEDPDFDVVLLDVKMPGMDGVEVLRRIRVGHPIVEVIMLTGHATFESAIECLKQGAFDYLMKPCEMEDLVIKVEAAREKRREHLKKIMEAEGKRLRGQRAR